MAKTKQSESSEWLGVLWIIYYCISVFKWSYTSVKFKPRANDLCGSCYKRNKVLTCKFQLYVASAQVTLQTTFTHTLEAEWCLPYGSILPFPFPVKLTAILSSFSKGLIKAMLGLYLLLTSPVVLLLSCVFFSVEISS